MGKTKRLATYCRLCLTKTTNKVPVFSDGNAMENLLSLIEIQIDSNVESDAVVCFDCVVTLEGFYQFKEQCHINDEFIRTIPPKQEVSTTEEESEEETQPDYLEEASYISEEEPHIIVKRETPKQIKKLETKTEKKAKEKNAEEWLPTNRKLAKNKSAKPPSKKQKLETSSKSVQPGRSISPKIAALKHGSNESLDIEKVEEECSQLNVPSRPARGPTIDEMQVLADSYPDFFYFEKGPRSIYFTLVFYGERYHSALFTERYTYWQCRHRRKYRCPAQVCVTNDYKTFERRYEHTHEELSEKEGKIYTPLEALPELFKACRKIVLTNRAKRRQKLVEKYKLINSIEAEQQAQQDSSRSDDNSQSDYLNYSGVYSEEEGLVEELDDDDDD